MAQQPTTATLCCLKTETELSNIAGGIYRGIQQAGRSFGMVQALEDNSGTTLTTVTNIRKSRPDGANAIKADVKYAVPRCDETPDTVPAFDCTAPAASNGTYQYEEFFFDIAVGEEFTVRQDLFDATCEDPQEELAREFLFRAQSMMTKYNRKLTEQMVARVGSRYEQGQFPDLTSVTAAPLKLFRPAADGASIPQPHGIYDLVYEYEQMNPLGGVSPVIVGGTKAVGAYEMGLRLYEGNTEGLDGNRVGNSALSGAYVDWALSTVVPNAVAPNPVISFLPGSVELAEWFEYDNDQKMIGQNGRITWAPVQATGTLVRQKVDIGTPIFGRPFIVDQQIQYNECDNSVTYKWRKDAGLFCIPDDAFCPGTTWNYKLLWNVVCAPYECADVL